jgi:hypothetical protein
MPFLQLYKIPDLGYPGTTRWETLGFSEAMIARQREDGHVSSKQFPILSCRSATDTTTGNAGFRRSRDAGTSVGSSLGRPF